MSFLSTLIKPEIAINMIRNQLSKHANAKVENFAIVFNTKSEDLQFYVAEQTFIMQDAKIKGLIMQKAKEQLKSGEKIDVIKIDCGKEIVATIYFTDGDNKKTFVTYKF